MLRYFQSFTALALLSTLGTVGCAGALGEDLNASDSALVSLTADQCKTPTVHSAPKTDAQGRPIAGTAKTSVQGCIVGKAGEAGTDVLARASALLGDTSKFGTLTDSTGQRVFSSFSPHAASGTLATGIVQDVDVTINVDFSPSTRLRVTRKQGSDGVLTVSISNITAVTARLAFLPVTVVNPNDLSLNVKLSAETNGISVAGTGEVTLQQQKDRAAESAQLVSQVFDWVKGQLEQ
jgi:hypothetical protein